MINYGNDADYGNDDDDDYGKGNDCGDDDYNDNYDGNSHLPGARPEEPDHHPLASLST